jgi:TetR/AcrR family transcriptional repressor of nem operon
MGIEKKARILDAGQRLAAAKGFSAVGLNEILSNAGVPKGSFYHYFGSKEQYGKALIDHYVSGYLQLTEELLQERSLSSRNRLMNYWKRWLDTQSGDKEELKCLIVKLSAEVADLSDEMRTALLDGVNCLVSSLAQCMEEGRADGSLPDSLDSKKTAEMLFQLWLGASLLAKLSRTSNELNRAMESTKKILSIM